MHPISQRRGAGFTMIEAMVVVAILGIALAIGVPAMTDWVRNTKVEGATEFYAEGFRLARAEAIKHKSASRISLDANAKNGQLDWQVDICFPVTDAPCNADAGNWSTITAIAAGDPEGATGFTSIARSAEALPGKATLRQTLLPAGANTVYFTPLGWVDTTVPARVSTLTLDAVPGTGYEFAPSAIAVTLSGMATKCRPDVPEHDSRGCPK